MCPIDAESTQSTQLKKSRFAEVGDGNNLHPALQNILDFAITLLI